MTNYGLPAPRPGADIGDLWSRKWPERKQFWGPVITKGSLTMLYAKSGIGKSFLAYKMMHSMVTGVKFLKWPGCGDVKGFIAEGEMGPQTLIERIIKIDDGSSQKAIGGSIHTLTYADCENSELWNISDPWKQKAYEDAFEDARVIIIDNLITASREMHKHDDDFSIWARIQPWLVQLRDRGFAVILVHHAGKSGAQLGTSKRDIIMDTVIELTDIPRADPDDRLKFDLHFRKSRHFFGEEAESLRVEMFTGDDGGFLWDWYPAKEIRRRQIQRYSDLGLTPRQIAKELNLDVAQIYALVGNVQHGSDEF